MTQNIYWPLFFTHTVATDTISCVTVYIGDIVAGGAEDDVDAVYCTLSVGTVAPSFSKMPRDLEVTANGRIVLECVAEGIPTPVISWKVNNTDFHRQYILPTL